jgi:hypothetical protein
MKRKNGNGAPRARVVARGGARDAGAPFQVIGSAGLSVLGDRRFELLTLCVRGATFSLDIEVRGFDVARQLAADITREIEQAIGAAEAHHAKQAEIAAEGGTT